MPHNILDGRLQLNGVEIIRDAIDMEVNEGLEGGDDAANRYLTDTAGQPSSL